MPVLQLKHNGTELDCSINKVDRSKLYGYTKTEVLDENEKPCSLATLASDGKTLIPGGGLALAYVSPKGLWRDKSDLKAVDLDGAPIKSVTSTFKEVVELKETATVEQFLDHNIRMAYALQAEGDDNTDFPPDLVAELAKGTIYTFPFSYRGGLTADTAFLLQGGDDTIWMLVGKKTDIHLIGYEQQGASTAVDDDGDSDDEDGDLDFGMM